MRQSFIFKILMFHFNMSFHIVLSGGLVITLIAMEPETFMDSFEVDVEVTFS